MAGSYIEHTPRVDKRKGAASSYGYYLRVIAKKYDPFTREMRQQIECDKINSKTEGFTEIVKRTPQLVMESSINQQLIRLRQKLYQGGEFKEPEPDKLAIRIDLVRKAEAEINSVFPWRRKRLRMKYVEENLPVIYDAKLTEWQRRKNDFSAVEALKKKEFEERSKIDCEKEKAPLLLKLSRDEAEVSKALKAEVLTLSSPGDYGLELFLDLANDSVYVDVDLPEITDLPTSKAELSASGDLSYREKTLREAQHDYVRCVCGIAFYIAGHFFNVNMNIKNVQVSGYAQHVNRSIGDYEDDYLYSVFFDKDTFSLLRFDDIDPLEAMRRFPLRINVSDLGKLGAIMPYPSPGDVDFIRGEKPQKIETVEEPNPEPAQPAMQLTYTPKPLGFMVMPPIETPKKDRPLGTYPVERVKFEGKEIIGDAYESAIRHRIPQYDFGVGPISERLRKNSDSLRRDLEPIYKFQQHFTSVLQAANKYEKEGRYDKACYHYEQLLYERYFETKPIERLIEIYDQANLPEAKKEVLTEAIALFKSKRESRAMYLDRLSARVGMPGAAQVNIIHGKIIYYYNYLFELYNPYKVIADWENELKRINEQFIQQPYNQDLNLPSHGRRAKADNEGTIRVRIIRGAGLIFTDKPEAFELYLNIKPENKTYHATLESEVHFEKKQVLDIEIPTEAIEEMVELAHDPSFLSLKNEDIFPNMVMMDGNDVTISVKTDVGNLTLESNLLDSTLWNGAILVDGDVIQTPFHLICAVAFEQLGIELDDEEEEEEEEEESPS